MSALQKLKAYFGMIPAESEEYDEYDGDGGYRRDYAEEGYDDYDDESRPARRHRSDYAADPAPRTRREPAVHGALAVERQPEPVTRLRTVPEEPRMTAAHRDPLSRITTLHPKSFVEARAIGEAYRDGIPVIINLTEMDNADAKRLVDFSAGLAFATRGSMDKITTKVFLLSPPDVEVTAEDCRRIAEGGLFRRH